ncbi:protein FAR1-related sequence 5 [Tanacetum coccineum]
MLANLYCISYKLDALCTPETLCTHSNFDTRCGTVYYIPKVSADVLLVKGNVYDSVDDCVVAYMKYSAEAGFVVRRSCQKRLRNGDVKQKYLVCNRKGCPKGIHVDTLDLENSDKQKRNSNLHITGCKARSVFNLVPCTRKFVLDVFDTIHNHELKLEKFKHLSKRERQLTYLEQAFIMKAASVNIGATRAHHLLTGIKGSYLLVHASTISSPLNQDGAMRNAIEAEFAGSKHRLCMWHITQKLPAKCLNVFTRFAGLKSPYVYEKLEEEEETSSVDKIRKKAEKDDTNILFFKKDGLYKVLRNVGDGSVVCSCQLFVRVGILCKHIFVSLRMPIEREPRLGAFVEKLKSLKKDVEADCPNPPSKNKTNNLEQLKMMAKQAELNNRISKGSSQREIRPVWNNVQRVNHQNQFVPKSVQTRTGKIPVNTAKTSGNGYPRKGQSQSQKRTKPSLEWKEREEKSNQSQKSKSKVNKSQPHQKSKPRRH